MSSLSHLLHLLALSGAVGSVLPALIAVVNQEPWSPRLKGLVTATMSLAAGLLTAWQQGQMSSWWIASVTVFAATAGAYRAFWLPTRWAPFIEALTSFVARPQQQSGE